jgi:uncharacterized membrane protein
MAICEMCKTEVLEGAQFCPSCGKSMKKEAQIHPQDAAQDAEKNKTMAVLAYILFFIPLLTGEYKNSPFLKFHTNQGTVLFIAAVIYGIAYGILSIILAFIPIIGWILILLLGLLSLGFVVFCIIGILNAVNGKLKELPIIGKMSIIK